MGTLEPGGPTGGVTSAFTGIAGKSKNLGKVRLYRNMIIITAVNVNCSHLELQIGHSTVVIRALILDPDCPEEKMRFSHVR